MNLSSGSRKAPSIPFVSIHKRFHEFAIATPFAVGLLVLALPAHAKVVYTPVNVTISGNGTITIPVRGMDQFTIQAVAKFETCESFQVSEASVTVTPILANEGNGVVAIGQDAAALSAGALIDSSQNFYEAQALMASELVEQKPPPCDVSSYGGYWCDENLGHPCTSVDGYLGLEFQVMGRTHYGWAHMIVTPESGSVMFIAQLQGFAYETVADQGIQAGQTSDSALMGPDQPATRASDSQSSPQNLTFWRPLS